MNGGHFEAVAVLGLCATAACGPNTSPRETEGADGEESTTAGEDGRTATSAVPGGSGDVVEPVACAEGEVACGPECANLRWSEEHCGECGHACTVVGLAGECWEGVCPPTRYCAVVEQGHQTCASVCASYGEVCVDAEPATPGACGGSRYGLFYGLTPEFACDIGYWSVAAVMGRCNDPIEWDLVAPINGGMLPEAVGCCCTQP